MALLVLMVCVKLKINISIKQDQQDFLVSIKITWRQWMEVPFGILIHRNITHRSHENSMFCSYNNTIIGKKQAFIMLGTSVSLIYLNFQPWYKKTTTLQQLYITTHWVQKEDSTTPKKTHCPKNDHKLFQWLIHWIVISPILLNLLTMGPIL